MLQNANMFSLTERGKERLQQVQDFVEDKIIPLESDILQEHHAKSGGDWTQWKVDPRLHALKMEAKSKGLWNMFLPDLEGGFSYLDYAAIAEATGLSLLAPEIFNCNAPDTGNMEVLWKYGSEEQKETWLKPLLAGDIRSAFCMTEPQVASSDATSMEARIEERGGRGVLKGTGGIQWYWVLWIPLG